MRDADAREWRRLVCKRADREWRELSPDVIDELAGHLADLYAASLAGGATEPEARERQIASCAAKRIALIEGERAAESASALSVRLQRSLPVPSCRVSAIRARVQCKTGARFPLEPSRRRSLRCCIHVFW